LDHLIEQAVTDLAANTLPLQTLAIGELRAQAPIDEDTLEGKLTAQLVEKGQLAVVDRKRLKLLLDEQGFSLSGAIDAKNAPEIGKLASVDGFLVGAVVFNENQLSVNLKIIATESGVVVWAKEMMEGKHQQEGDMMQHMQ
jgi:TolB-like protein